MGYTYKWICFFDIHSADNKYSIHKSFMFITSLLGHYVQVPKWRIMKKRWYFVCVVIVERLEHNMQWTNYK